MKKTTIAAMAIFILLSFCFATAGNAQQKPIEWKFCVSMAYAKGYDFMQTYIQNLEKELNGQIKFIAFQPGEHPYGVGDVMKAVRDGVMQIGFSLNIYTQSFFPQMGLQELPFIFGSTDEFRALLEDPQYQDVVRYILLEPLEKWNQTAVGWYPMDGYMFAGPKFIEDFNSFDGLRIRVYSEPMSHMIKLFGGSPVNIVWDEVYTALQRKMADGFVTATYPAYSARLYEVCKYVTITDFSMGLHFVTVNNDALKSLPEDLRNKFLAACKKLNPELSKATWDKDNYAIKQAMRVNGVRFKVIDPQLREEARKKMAPAWDTWVKRTGGDSEKILGRINQFHADYMKKSAASK